jgi:hypothetical protein
MTGPTTSTAAAALDSAQMDVKAELARTDTKASLLLAFVGAVLAGVLTVAASTRPPLPALVVGGMAALLLVAAAWLLLTAVRPDLSGGSSGTFPRLARLSVEQITDVMRADRRAHAVHDLSRIAVAKFTALQRAVDLIRAAVVLLTVAGVLAIGGVL